MDWANISRGIKYPELRGSSNLQITFSLLSAILDAEDSGPSSLSSQRSTDKQTDVDPNLPSTLRKEDVLKMTREKARFSAQSRRASEGPFKSQQAINHKVGSLGAS